ncbi:uncharacterized protein LOC144434076 [Glandiceps talaboti]
MDNISIQGKTKHKSIVTYGSLDELFKDLPKAGSKYCCPLCPSDKFKPAWPSKVKKHLRSHNHGIDIGEYNLSILACHLECRKKKKDKHAHYHCPSCRKTIARKDGFIIHWEECSKMFNPQSFYDNTEDSGCYMSTDEDSQVDEKDKLSCYEESMDTSSSYQLLHQIDMPDISYESLNGKCTDADSVYSSVDMDDASDVTTEGVSSHENYIQDINLSRPVSESQTSIPNKGSQLPTCTPVEESNQTPHVTHNLSMLKHNKGVQLSAETQKVMEQSLSEYSGEFEKSGFQERRHTTYSQEDSTSLFGQDSHDLILNPFDNDKMESDVALDMCLMSLKEIVNTLSPLNQQHKPFSSEEFQDDGGEGKCFDMPDIGNYPSWHNTGETHHIDVEKVGSCKEPPDIPVPCLSHHLDYTDIKDLHSYLFCDGKLEDLTGNTDTEMDEIEVLKIRAQRDPVNRVELM